MAYINGASGIYNDTVQNKSIRYGRNAANNLLGYVNELSSDDNGVPKNFKMKYMPGNVNFKKIDKMALMGEAYEEMGGRTSIDTDKFTKFLQLGHNEEMSAEALDLNRDGKIDVAEYSSSVLLADALSSNIENGTMKVDGTITDKGQDEVLPYGLKKNYEIAAKTYRAFYETYRLDEAQEEFLKENAVS